MRARRTGRCRGWRRAAGGARSAGRRPPGPRQQTSTPGLRYRLEATYEVLPTRNDADLEDALDRVSADRHPHEVRLRSRHGRVLVPSRS